MSVTAPVLEVARLRVAFGTHTVLDGVDLTIDRGEVVALTGPNGCGKSTLAKAIVGIVPYSGTVLLNGSKAGATIGYVPQLSHTGSSIPASALEVVMAGLLGRTRLTRRRHDRELALAALERVGMGSFANRCVHYFSGGQMQRVLIARALVRNPDLLIMDEPMSGIDREARQQLADIIAQCAAGGVATGVILHELGELAPIITRTLALTDGVVTEADGATVACDETHPHHHLGEVDRTHTPNLAAGITNEHRH